MFWGIFAVGIVIALFISFIYVNNAPLYDSKIKTYLMMSLGGITVFLFIALGLAEFINWFKRQGMLWRILSIIFYPYTLVVIFGVGVIKAIFLLPRKIKSYIRKK